jgi:hypothetical protein
MKHCDTCNATYSDDFQFCPADATALRFVSECEGKSDVSVSPGYPKRSNAHRHKWLFVIVAALSLGALFVFTSLKSAQSHNQDDSQPSVMEKADTMTKAAKEHRSVRRATHSEASSQPNEPHDGADLVIEEARVQQLVAAGYRQMQQREYQGARDSFEEALKIDPHSVAAQKGLKASQMAESVEGVAGVFRR